MACPYYTSAKSHHKAPRELQFLHLFDDVRNIMVLPADQQCVLRAEKVIQCWETYQMPKSRLTVGVFGWTQE